jgi:hypothetical protein
MGSLKKLRERLARLEARKGGSSSPGAPKTPSTDYLLHCHTWAAGGSFEDIPEKNRDASLWETVSTYGPVFLGLIREGVLPGYKELLKAGVDFTRATDVSAGIVGGRRKHAPNTPRQP